MHIYRQKSLQGCLFWLLDKPLAVYGFESQHITTLFSNVLCRPRENYWHVAENQSFKRVAEIMFFPPAHKMGKHGNSGRYLTLPVGKCRIHQV